MATNEIIFETLGKQEKVLLLKAFDYGVDNEGFILDNSGNKIASQENPSEFLNIENAMLIPGSLKVVDGTPTNISKFIRERITKDDTSTTY